MTKLNCNVTSCPHNADNYYCKQAIVVDGQDARDKQGTCCGSFDENRNGTFHNLFKTPGSRLEVDCGAMRCVYNEGRHCTARHIDTTGDEATETTHTKCTTFKAK